MIHVLGMLRRLTLVKNNIVHTAELLTNPQYHYWVLGYLRILRMDHLKEFATILGLCLGRLK